MECHHSAKHTKDDIRLPLDIGEGWCDEVRQCEVEDPITGCRESNSFRAIFEWEDLR